ncbi:MAG: hypothetical protein WCE30_08790 [Mycobacterium sp.]
MPAIRLVTAVSAVIVAATLSTGPAWAGGENGVVENPGDISAAVGSGVLGGAIVGFTATGATNEEAMAHVVAACQQAGADQCTADEETNDRLCIVNVDHSATGVVAGGAGVTVDLARQDAFNRAAANNTPLDPADPTLAVSCP